MLIISILIKHKSFFYLTLRSCKKKKYIHMALASEAKKEIFAKFGGSETNTGSTEAQIAMFSKRISDLTEHLKLNRKDFGTQRSLIRLVGKRRSMLDYLKGRDIEKYRELIKELGLRK